MNKTLQRALIMMLCILFVATPLLFDTAEAMRGHGGGHHGGHGGGHPHHNPHPHMHVWHPHVWWHPVGFTLAVLATTAIVVSIADDSGSSSSDSGIDIYYDRGTFYQKQGESYIVIQAPIGAVVPELPEGNESTKANGQQYYFYAGDFYAYHGGDYIVVEVPVGAEVGSLPDGYEEKESGDGTYYVYNGVWYEPVTSGDTTMYAVTTGP